MSKASSTTAASRFASEWWRPSTATSKPSCAADAGTRTSATCSSRLSAWPLPKLNSSLSGEPHEMALRSNSCSEPNLDTPSDGNNNVSSRPCQEPSPAALHLLGVVAHRVNRLAKRLRGEDRLLAYYIKSLCCSGLICGSFAAVNGQKANGMIGLDITGLDGLHVPLHQLTPEAQLKV